MVWYEPGWSSMVLYGPLWSCMLPYMVPHGPLWSSMALYSWRVVTNFSEKIFIQDIPNKMLPSRIEFCQAQPQLQLKLGLLGWVSFNLAKSNTRPPPRIVVRRPKITKLKLVELNQDQMDRLNCKTICYLLLATCYLPPVICYMLPPTCLLAPYYLLISSCY